MAIERMEVCEEGVTGYVSSGFERVAAVFSGNVRERGDAGAAVSIYHAGIPVVDLQTTDLPRGSVQLVRSVSKGVVAILVHHLAERGVLDVDAPVAEVWPEFSAKGKAEIPLRWILSHRAGLSAVSRRLVISDVLSTERVIEALANQAPWWTPGVHHGYHDLTFGWLIGEILRRVTGRSIGDLVAREISHPLGLNFWIGMPADGLSRLSKVAMSKGKNDTGSHMTTLARHLSDPSSLSTRSYLNPDVSSVEQDPQYLMAEVPSANGVSDARSLARVYAATVGKVDGVRLLSRDTLADAVRVQSEGQDIVAHRFARYASGFMLPYPMREMGGLESSNFGHYGQGGPLGFGDYELSLGFGYTTTQERIYPASDPRSRLLAEAAVSCAAQLEG